MSSSLNRLTFVLRIVAIMLPTSVAYAGPGASGGGNAIAAQFSEVAQRAAKAIENICVTALANKTADSKTAAACTHQLNMGSLDTVYSMIVRPRSRNQAKTGLFGKPRDAVDDNSVILLDVDRWNDLQNESDPNKIPSARLKQVTLAIHMPLVMVQSEGEDSYSISNESVQLLLTRGVSFDSLVGIPPVSVSPSTNHTGNSTEEAVKPSAVASQYFQVAMRAYNAVSSIGEGIKKDSNNRTLESDFCPAIEYPFYFTVVPKRRNSIRGDDGNLRDAGNDGISVVFLDANRWTDLQNEADPSRILNARIQQVTLALHEPLVLGHDEIDDSYLISAMLVNLLLKNKVNFVELVGAPSS